MGNCKLLLASVVLFCLSACSAQKQPAEHAFAQVQSAVDPVSADLEKYAPEDFAKLSDLIGQMKAKLNAKDYEAVLALQPRVMQQLIATSGVTAKKRQELTKQLSGDWKSLSVEVPKLIADISNRLDVLRGQKQLPPGIGWDQVNQAEAQLPSLNAGWKAVMGQHGNGSVDSAIARAKELRARCVQIGNLLGMKVAA